MLGRKGAADPTHGPIRGGATYQGGAGEVAGQDDSCDPGDDDLWEKSTPGQEENSYGQTHPGQRALQHLPYSCLPRSHPGLASASLTVTSKGLCPGHPSLPTASQGSPLPKAATLQQGPMYPVCRHMPGGRPWDTQGISPRDGEDFRRNTFHYQGTKLKMRLKQELVTVTHAWIPGAEAGGHCGAFKASLIHTKSSSLARTMSCVPRGSAPYEEAWEVASPRVTILV